MTKERFLNTQKPVSVIEKDGMITVHICVNMRIVNENEKKYYEYDCNSFTENASNIDTTLLAQNPKSFLDYQPASSSVYDEIMGPISQAIIRGLTI